MIYLDNAATTMRKPDVVIQAVTEALGTMGNAGRGSHNASLGASRIIYDTRERLAQFFNAENPMQVVFTMNSTESLNIAIKGILEKGDHAITTALEHNSVLRPLYEMEEKGVELTIIPVPRAISAGCGLAWAAKLESESVLRELMAQKGINPQAVQECLV